MEELIEKIDKMNLLIQDLEERVKKMETSSYATGIYVDGCKESDVKYILNDEDGR